MKEVKKKMENPAKSSPSHAAQNNVTVCFLTLDFKKTNINQFKEFWVARYSDPHETLYEDNIEKIKTQETIERLFEWKNVRKLSASKLDGVKKKYKPYEDVWKDRTQLPCDKELIKELSMSSAIWRIFWLHCQNPCEFPIYDQHSHRAMMYMKGERSNLEIPSSDKEKAVTYFHEFLPFFRDTFGKPSDWKGMREADKALFAFGKFLETGWVP